MVRTFVVLIKLDYSTNVQYNICLLIIINLDLSSAGFIRSQLIWNYTDFKNLKKTHTKKNNNIIEPPHEITSNVAYAQSDQSLCWLLEYSINFKLLTEQHLEFLSLSRGCTGLSVSTLVRMPHCWKSHVMAHMLHVLFLFWVPSST